MVVAVCSEAGSSQEAKMSGSNGSESFGEGMTRVVERSSEEDAQLGKSGHCRHSTAMEKII